MQDILLSKSTNKDEIDLAIGEASLIKNNLFKYIDYSEINNLNTDHNFEYLPPNGYPDLVKFLEDQHQAPIVITNGAKGALAACFYALKKHNYKSIGMKSPWWALLPPIIQSFNLEWKTSYVGADACLAVLPNNPDGYMASVEEIANLLEECKDKNIPLIHDAVYYSNLYLPKNYQLQQFGNLQIFSASKYLGLSGIRIGYIVCNDHNYYYDLCEYQEMMSVGVSVLSQNLFLNILKEFKNKPYLKNNFESSCREDLKTNKKLLLQINKEVIEFPDNFIDNFGMFAFVKIKNKKVFTDNKIKIIDGIGFGASEMSRINLAVSKDIMRKVVEKINNSSY